MHRVQNTVMMFLMPRKSWRNSMCAKISVAPGMTTSGWPNIRLAAITATPRAMAA
ncbi:hypothetical protein D3C73_1452020 [compost metagenome]